MRKKLFPPTLPLLVLLILEGCATTTASCVVEKDGEIPILGYYYNLPLAAIEIEGKQELMVVDTGSVTSTLTPNAAADLDIKDSAPYPLAMAGVDGAEHDVPSTYRGIQIPGIDIQNTLFLIDKLFPTPSGTLAAVDGTIGDNVLLPFDVDLDLPDDKITLYQATNCAPEQSLPPWPPPYASFLLPQTIDRFAYLTALIGGGRIPMVLDTGSAHSAIPEQFLIDNGVRPTRTITNPDFIARGYGHRLVRIELARFERVQIGAETFPHYWLSVLDRNSPLRIGLLGEDYIQHHRIFIANSTNRIYISPAAKDP